MSRRRRIDYKLLLLRDAHSCIRHKVNIIAIVLEFGPPKKSNGTDFCCILRLIDETHYKSGITVNVFTANADSLPCISAAGDIIHLCGVTLNTHLGEVNVVFYKNSSFALYKGKSDDGDFVPYQAYSKIFLRDEDKLRIVSLRKWLVDFHIPEDSSGFPMLKEIKEGHSNLACKLEPTMPRDLVCSFPTVGSILRIFFELPTRKDHLHALQVGTWVKFVNIRLSVCTGLWYGVFNSYTKLRYTTNEDRHIIERQRLYEERISLQSGRMPFGTIPQSIDSLSESLRITKVHADHVQHFTLMDVLTHSEVTARFNCVVRVVAAMPYQAEKLCFPAGGVYRMKLTLEDPTARIHAAVVGADGETLFDGYPGIENVRRKMNRLLGVTERGDGIVLKDYPRNPPWVSVCIISFYSDKTNLWRYRKFRVCDTKIVGDP
ncbi:protection of telomeres protein 1b-like isoform X2 [Cicer arietinum]|uniref:Protection of telomeres protein 1b-like isoform X2 n=1 Tax=Cicer arietinum TaxID=3827 RepID=A0A1S3E8C4_CICAR|nr:protection of telomeres protein 1b-like isoform X2 [Cicer arietinum]